MLAYTLRRFGYMVFTLWLIITLTFLLMHAVPGDPFTSEKKVPEAIRQNLLHKYGLDLPLPVQYIRYLNNILHGDLGISMRYPNRTVNQMIAQGFPHSADVGMRALVFAVSVGLTLGVLAAFYRDRPLDRTAMVIAVIGISVPNFVVGTLLQYLFSVRLRLLPVVGWGTFKQSILPSFALGLGTLAVMARMMRASLLDVLNQDYVRTAQSKGLSNREVVLRHTIRNAILPIVTILGPLVINIITGTLVVEQIFGIPGLGKHYVQSVYNLDYTLIMGTTIFYAALLLFAIFLVDIAYGLVDPRIRLVRPKE
ncbi:MAG: ABC transporter permease [Bacillota bacterium]|nr:ABC transporter permease [Bacillota bacterium]